MKARTGRAAKKGYGLREKGVLIIGSGSMVLNLGLVEVRGGPRDFT